MRGSPEAVKPDRGMKSADQSQTYSSSRNSQNGVRSAELTNGFGQPSFSDLINRYRPDLTPFEDLYKDIHRHPELGKQESRTASVVIEHLKALGLGVETKIGGHGVVGVLDNGPGPIILIRAELDALPIMEETGLPYASNSYQHDADGVLVPVMHACGHDLHIVCQLAVITLFKSAKSEWKGTLICLFQPNEENGAGAQAMVDDALYQRIPVPDLILFQHVDDQKSGTVSICSGPTQAGAEYYDVRIFGRGGHGAQPENCIDPIVIASYIIVRLQCIVSRLLAPLDSAVITCGSIHGGQTGNTIPDFVDLKLSIRFYDPRVREKILDTMRNIIHAECKASAVPREPTIKKVSDLPPTINNAKVVEKIRNTWEGVFGELVHHQEKKSSSEDVANLATAKNIPYAVWFLGGTDQVTWDDAMASNQPDLIPKNHSSKFAPAIHTTLRTGVDALALAIFSFVNRTCSSEAGRNII